MRHSKMKLKSIFQLVDDSIMRQMQLEMIFYLGNSINGAETDEWLSRTTTRRRWEI